MHKILFLILILCSSCGDLQKESHTLDAPVVETPLPFLGKGSSIKGQFAIHTPRNPSNILEDAAYLFFNSRPSNTTVLSYEIELKNDLFMYQKTHCHFKSVVENGPTQLTFIFPNQMRRTVSIGADDGPCIISHYALYHGAYVLDLFVTPKGFQGIPSLSNHRVEDNNVTLRYYRGSLDEIRYFDFNARPI